MTMTNPGARERLSDAVQEMEAIGEIMLELSQNPTRDDALVPAAWMRWLGACICDATKRASDALDDLGRSGRG